MPRNPDGSITISTIQDHIDNGHKISVHCHGTGADGHPCHHSSTICLDELGKRIGYDHPALARDLKPYFRCSLCGSKDVGFIVTATSGGMGVNTPSDQPDLTKPNHII
jgi:hypothetical protein